MLKKGSQGRIIYVDTSGKFLVVLPLVVTRGAWRLVFFVGA